MADVSIPNRIDALLKSYVKPGDASPYFVRVYQGDPVALGAAPLDRMACWWFVGNESPPEGASTLTGRMYQYRFRVKCLWLPSPIESARESREAEIFAIHDDLPQIFAQDETLFALSSHYVAHEGVDVQSEEFPPGVDGAPVYRTMAFDLVIRNLEGGRNSP